MKEYYLGVLTPQNRVISYLSAQSEEGFREAFEALKSVNSLAGLEILVENNIFNLEISFEDFGFRWELPKESLEEYDILLAKKDLKALKELLGPIIRDFMTTAKYNTTLENYAGFEGALLKNISNKDVVVGDSLIKNGATVFIKEDSYGNIEVLDFSLVSGSARSLSESIDFSKSPVNPKLLFRWFDIFRKSFPSSFSLEKILNTFEDFVCNPYLEEDTWFSFRDFSGPFYGEFLPFKIKHFTETAVVVSYLDGAAVEIPVEDFLIYVMGSENNLVPFPVPNSYRSLYDDSFEEISRRGVFLEGVSSLNPLLLIKNYHPYLSFDFGLSKDILVDLVDFSILVGSTEYPPFAASFTKEVISAFISLKGAPNLEDFVSVISKV